MTYSVLGIDTTQIKENDPRTGKEKVFYVPKINPQTGKEERVRLAQAARRQGTYLIGATGTGKSAVILNLGLQDIKQGKGIAVLDPHSDLINSFLARLDEKDLERVILLDPLDETHVFGLNLYACADPTNDVFVQGTYEQVEHIFDVLWHEEGEDQFGPQVREGLLYSAYALIYNSGTAYAGCGMLEIPLLFQEGIPRAKMVQHIHDPVIRSYWEKKYEPFDRYEKARRADMVVNKLNEFIANPIFRRIVGQSTTIDFSDVMENGKILLVKLPGRFERMAQILGAMVIAQLLGASYEREKQHKRPQFNIYADEFQRFATRDFAKLLTEASRKYNTPVTIAHQARDFIDLKNKAASLQVANLIVLRIIRKDADEFAGNFDCTPIRTKKVLKRRTKPIFKYWDETVWIENGEELYQQALTCFEEEYNREREQLTIELQEAVEEEQKRLLALRKIQELERYFPSCWATFYPTWCNERQFRGYISRSFYTQPQIKSPIKYYETRDGRRIHYEPPDEYEIKYGEGWTDEKVERLIGELVEINEYVGEGKFMFKYCGNWFGERYTRYMNVTYDYLEREERYTFSENTLTNIQAIFKENISKVTFEEVILELFVFEESLNEVVRKVLDQGIWFKPDLLPYPLDNRYAGEYREQLFVEPPERVVDDAFRGKITQQVIHMMTNYPLLDYYPQPKIGEKRALKGWTQHGVWRMPDYSWAKEWLKQRSNAIHIRVQEASAIYAEQEKKIKEIQDKLRDLIKQHEEALPKIKAQYQKTVHHKDYLGEQPEVEERIRISHSYSQGSSETTGSSWPGTSHSYGTSSSKSTSYSPNDVQWYDLVDELDQTPDQRRDEIAGEITMLPDYVARVKIKDENDEFVEYTIRTLKPEEGLRGQALNERIARIKETMIGNNIIRPKHIIDEEIRKRQQALRRPQLEPPHKQGMLPPPEDEPPITRRG